MSTTAFAPGIMVSYKGQTGTIRFVDENYLTICIQTEATMGPVCIVVYRFDWGSIELVKSNR